MKNKKIINASPKEFNGIKFKSVLEVSVYKTLLQEGFNPEYESYKYHIWEGFKPQIPFYIKDKKTKSLKLDNTKIIDITYTPDISFTFEGKLILIEVKPDFCNDVYPYKRKLFRKYLENNGKNVIFAQIGSKKNLIEFINILRKNYGKFKEDKS